uniref:hypothetical protein n=1 Tax=Leuconostoc suionicum TaxID=1511761 RepID=UPI0035D4B7DC
MNLDPGNVLDFLNLDRHTLLRMNIHARIKYSAQRGQYIATKKRFRMGQGLLLTPELIEYWVNGKIGRPNRLLAT